MLAGLDLVEEGLVEFVMEGAGSERARGSLDGLLWALVSGSEVGGDGEVERMAALSREAGRWSSLAVLLCSGIGGGYMEWMGILVGRVWRVC